MEKLQEQRYSADTPGVAVGVVCMWFFKFVQVCFG